MTTQALTPDSIKALRDGIEQISTLLESIKSKRETINDIIEAVEDETSIPKKTLRRMAKTFHQHSFNDERAGFSEFESIYALIFGINSSNTL